MLKKYLQRVVVFSGSILSVNDLIGQDSSGNQKFNLHFQTTYIYQFKPSFHSHYKGENSLTGEKEKENSITATLYAGLRLWRARPSM